MSYVKTTWSNGATALSAENMNHIENGIEALDAGITEGLAALDASKVDKVTGKGLSTNDYTTAEKNKLAGIASGAEVNVQSDWNQTTTTADDYIKNKPGNASTSAAGFMTAADKTKLNGIAAGAEVNQNAFSNVKVGSSTIAADSKTDTLTLAAGTNISLTPDTTNDKVTINSSIPNASASAAGLMSSSNWSKLNGMSNFVAGHYHYEGAEISGYFTFTDSKLVGKDYIVATTHNVGNTIELIVFTNEVPGEVKVYFTGTLNEMQVDYIAW